MTIKEVLPVCIISTLIIAANAGWCYYGGCHAETGLFEKACPSMADNVGRDNMSILFHTKCDRWHETLWGRKHFCCTNDCKYQKCGKKCTMLGMKEVENTHVTSPKECTLKTVEGDAVANSYFCCP